MKPRSFLVPVLFILLTEWILPKTEAISLAALLLLRQVRLQQVRQNNPGPPRPSWGEWTGWSTCTSPSTGGIRVRSRPCNGVSCNNLMGDNYQLEDCRTASVAAVMQNQGSPYWKTCTEDPNMNRTLSCRLYRENPTMAYTIFQSTGCLFNVIGDQSEGDRPEQNVDGENAEELAFGRPPNVQTGEVGLAFLQDLNTAPLSSGRIINEEVTPSTARPAGSQASSLLTQVLTFRPCQATCEAIIVRATNVGRFGASAPTTVAGIIQLLIANPLFRNNGNLIRAAYNRCLYSCVGTNGLYGILSNRFPVDNSGLQVFLITETEQVTGEQRRRRKRSLTRILREESFSEGNFSLAQIKLLNLTLNVSSRYVQGLASSKLNEVPQNQEGENGSDIIGQLSVGKKSTPKPSELSAFFHFWQKNRQLLFGGAKVPPTHPLIKPTRSSCTSAIKPTKRILRQKRQLRQQPNDYRSPCIVSQRISRSPRVLNLDDTEGELFFYEGNQQKFLRRSCAGRTLAPTSSLYRPRELVLHTRTNTQAVCKQIYLERYGLMIQLDPKGDFAFNDGERFSVVFRAFKLESDCSLSILAR